MAQRYDIEIDQKGTHAIVEATLDGAFVRTGEVSSIAFRVPDVEPVYRFDDDEPFDVVGSDGRRSQFVVLRKVGRQRLAVGMNGSHPQAA